MWKSATREPPHSSLSPDANYGNSRNKNSALRHRCQRQLMGAQHQPQPVALGGHQQQVQQALHRGHGCPRCQHHVNRSHVPNCVHSRTRNGATRAPHPPPHSRQRIPTQVQRSLNFRHLRHKLRPHRSTPPKPAPPACPPHTNHALLRAHGAHVQCKRQLRAQPAASPQHQARHLCGTKNSPPTRQQRLLHPRWTHPSPTFLLKSTQLSREWKQHSLHPTLTPHNRC